MQTDMSAGSPEEARAWFSEPAADVAAALGSDTENGLTVGEADARLTKYGKNTITAEKPPSVWLIALGQLREPMNLMLVAVVVVSVAIGQVSTGLIVALLIVLNVVLGSRQELKARASVDALSNLQVPQAKVVRDGTLQMIDAPDVVPGDIVTLEAGDLVPADGRILRSATVEVQEAALTGRVRQCPRTPPCCPPGMSASGIARTCFSRTRRSPAEPLRWSSRTLG